MNILFITLLDIRSINTHDIYTDLIRELSRHGHNVYVASPIERKYGKTSYLIHGNTDEVHERVKILKFLTGNIQKTNIIEKGISTLLIEYQLYFAIRKYFSNIHFDLVLYSTPPITIIKPIKFIKNRDNATSYLMLKDIFPQNAVDIGLLSKTGAKGVLYKYFRYKEKKLYALSDYIGCMSMANVEYLIKHNPGINSAKVMLCPNSVDPVDLSISFEEKKAIREKYGIPLDKKVFVYGGNLGKPQGIPFLIECLKDQIENNDVFFLIIGDGTDYSLLEKYVNNSRPKNVKLMKRLPKEDYDRMVGSCDVGLIFLDYRFSIPNFPSRLLTYMQVKIPVFAVTDANTDIGTVISEGGFGWWCESNNLGKVKSTIDLIYNSSTGVMGKKGYSFLVENYSSDRTYSSIMKAVRNTRK